VSGKNRSINRAWTKAELETLAILAGAGMRLAAIALRMGRSYDSVRWRLRTEAIAVPSIGPQALAAPDLQGRVEAYESVSAAAGGNASEAEASQRRSGSDLDPAARGISVAG
jgi:hypothetical protein